MKGSEHSQSHLFISKSAASLYLFFSVEQTFVVQFKLKWEKSAFSALNHYVIMS